MALLSALSRLLSGAARHKFEGYKPPKCHLAPNCKTYPSRIKRLVVRNFQISIVLQPKCVNNVCKLVQLLPRPLSELRPGPHWGDPLGYSPQMTISGAPTEAAL